MSMVASHQRRWTREGLRDRILAALHGELAEAGRIDWELGPPRPAAPG
jgi:hypothetical protein